MSSNDPVLVLSDIHDTAIWPDRSTYAALGRLIQSIRQGHPNFHWGFTSYNSYGGQLLWAQRMGLRRKDLTVCIAENGALIRFENHCTIIQYDHWWMDFVDDASLLRRLYTEALVQIQALCKKMRWQYVPTYPDILAYLRTTWIAENGRPIVMMDQHRKVSLVGDVRRCINGQLEVDPALYAEVVYEIQHITDLLFGAEPNVWSGDGQRWFAHFYEQPQKGKPLAWLRDHFPGRIIVFGDGKNDVSNRIDGVTLVAVKNACPELQAVADVVTWSHGPVGICVFLSELFKMDIPVQENTLSAIL